MPQYRVRVITVKNRTGAGREIALVGADEPGCRLMAPKAVHRLVKISGLKPVQANIVKQEMLARGGDAAVSRGTVVHRVDRTDVLLMGTLKQYRGFMAKLRMQPFGLPALAAEIGRVLRCQEGYRARELNCRGHLLPLGRRTLVMGILNVTPDSFSDGGRYDNPEAALNRAREMVAAGADIIDVGGESTRPGHTPLAAPEEWRRLEPVLERLVRAVPVPVAVDTSKAEVAERALAAGVHLLNDQWALAGEGMPALAARYGVPVIAMHNQQGTAYRDLMDDITAYFQRCLQRAEAAGIDRERVILDPGFGFGKNALQNLEVLRRLGELKGLGCPLLIGTSRKRTIGLVLDLPVDQRVEGTAATVAVGITHGADIIRVHDVREMVRVARMTDAIVRGWTGDGG